VLHPPNSGLLWVYNLPVNACLEGVGGRTVVPTATTAMKRKWVIKSAGLAGVWYDCGERRGTPAYLHEPRAASVTRTRRSFDNCNRLGLPAFPAWPGWLGERM
jgi:hypothetical protein